MGSIAVIASEAGGRRNNDSWKIITSLVLDGLSSPHTRRAYSQALDEFLIWFHDDPGRQFNKAAVQKYRAELETKGLAPSSINVRLSVIRRLALEAADNGVMTPELAAGIARAKGAKRGGVRLGHWLTAEQAERFLALPDLTTLKGIRDGAVLAILLGAGLRRSELASLDFEHIQWRDGRWVIVDLAGKQGRIRSVPIPLWAHAAVTRWKDGRHIGGGCLPKRNAPRTAHAAADLAPGRLHDCEELRGPAPGRRPPSRLEAVFREAGAHRTGTPRTDTAFSGTRLGSHHGALPRRQTESP